MANYVDNKKLTKELGVWGRHLRAQIKAADQLGMKDTLCLFRMTDYIAECVFLICNNMSYKSSFINYTYKEDMIGDAIENCVRYIKNFNIEKNNNAFGYVSTIAYFAFVRRIKKENKRHIDHLSFIRKTFSEDDIRKAIDADNPNDIKNYVTYVDHMQTILDNMDIEIPEKKKKKDKKRKGTNVDIIMTGEKY